MMLADSLPSGAGMDQGHFSAKSGAVKMAFNQDVPAAR